jgi:hypothetical protein
VKQVERAVAKILELSGDESEIHIIGHSAGINLSFYINVIKNLNLILIDFNFKRRAFGGDDALHGL